MSRDIERGNTALIKGEEDKYTTVPSYAKQGNMEMPKSVGKHTELQFKAHRSKKVKENEERKLILCARGLRFIAH